MCGIAGFYGYKDDGGATGDAEALTGRMIDRLAHRGPDDRGVWVDAASGIGLGHRRLSIVDLSAAGHQPMRSSHGRYVISYNGEIFNWQELRAELPPPETGYQGHSDTEILLRGCEVWGLAALLPKLIGFFAIALWDCETRTLTLVRDRMGIKPLLWTKTAGGVLFGSELSALTEHPDCRTEIDREALAGYLRWGAVPDPFVILQGIRKLPAGGMLTVGPELTPQLRRYWSLEEVALSGLRGRNDIDDDARATEWEALLSDAVARRMVADVPLGAFLSGGIDSSAIVALMQSQSVRRVKTYTIGFEAAGYDEAPFARKVAAHLGTDHTEFTLTDRDALSLVPQLGALYDEPFADSSQIPTALICRLARGSVTVALSGDGGDELFGGYNRHLLAERYWPLLRLLPAAMRRLAANLIALPSPQQWDRVMPGAQFGNKLHKLAGILGCSDIDQLYRRLISQNTDPARLMIGGQEPPLLPYDPPPGLSDLERLQFCDQASYLPNDILTKVDRASMAVALEVRVPFLDHRLVKQSWTLPASAKIRDGTTKYLLRQVLYRHVPRALLERPKMGFGVPLDAWLRGPLRDWAAALLDPVRLRQQGLLREAPISALWQAHLSGRANFAPSLWTILMFQAWQENRSKPV